MHTPEHIKTLAQAYARRLAPCPKVTLTQRDVGALQAHVALYVEARREAYGFECGFDGRELEPAAEDAYALNREALAEDRASDLRLSHEQALEVAGLTR